ncbi:MAG: T9SS type A sorting domain-containing protein, partial [Bacteroidota bacterium]|nr:T9SS type A sorting domain-containing protein [Bacteroidota bacterium]
AGPGAEIKGHIYIYNTATQAYDLISSTDFALIETTDKNKWKTIPLTSAVQLNAGKFYRVAIEGFQHNTDTVFIATSGYSRNGTSHILDKAGCIGGNIANTYYYINGTPMIRLNVASIYTSVKDDVVKPISFSVYPNPNTGEFNLNMTNEKAGTYMISISNLIGQQVYTERVTVTNGNLQKSMNLSNFEKGIYILTVSDEGSKAKTVRKIVTY